MHVSTIKKLYYSIGEVSKITSLKKYVLRYWETEFDALRPGKNRAGNRIYKQEDIKTIFLIKKLLYEEKYTLEGAKKKLAELRRDKDFQLKLSFEELKKDDVILDVKRGLRELLEFLDSPQIGLTKADADEPPAASGEPDDQEKSAEDNGSPDSAA